MPPWFYPCLLLVYILFGGLFTLVLMALSPNDRRAAVNDPLIAGVLIFSWPLMFAFFILGIVCFFLGSLFAPLFRLLFPNN